MLLQKYLTGATGSPFRAAVARAASADGVLTMGFSPESLNFGIPHPIQFKGWK